VHCNTNRTLPSESGGLLGSSSSAAGVFTSTAAAAAAAPVAAGHPCPHITFCCKRARPPPSPSSHTSHCLRLCPLPLYPPLPPKTRFVTRGDLSRLGLDHLLGSPLLRAYMHGFFMDARLYSKAAAAAQPHAYEAWRAAKVAQKLEEERQGRISVARKLPKVGRTVCLLGGGGEGVCVCVYEWGEGR